MFGGAEEETRVLRQNLATLQYLYNVAAILLLDSGYFVEAGVSRRNVCCRRGNRADVRAPGPERFINEAVILNRVSIAA